MGCATSKHSKCKHCNASYSPMKQRSFSMSVHRPLEMNVDVYHSITLKSSTLGSIKLDPSNNSLWDEFEGGVDEQKSNNDEVGVDKSKEFTMGMIEAKSWSKMIDEKIPKVFPRTPIRTPPGEPETINVDELMEGLEGVSPLRVGGHVRSFSFHVSVDSIPPLVDSPRGIGGCVENSVVSPRKTIWFDSREKENDSLENVSLICKNLVSGFDPEVISSFRKALVELSPRNPLNIKPLDGVLEVTEENLDGILSNEVVEEKRMNGCDRFKGFVDRVTIEDEKENFAPPENGFVEEELVDDESVEENEYVHCEKKRVVLYFTSLRGVRKTYEDCCYVRVTLKGLGVRVDERDVSMHLGFKEELKEALGEDVKGSLPKVFVGDKYIGGVEEIQKLHEDGKLEKVVEGCEMIDGDSGNLIEVCEGCGDIRFVPCETCSGSCKIYYEFEDDDEEYEEDEYGFQRCPDCNENGLVRCPLCCY